MAKTRVKIIDDSKPESPGKKLNGKAKKEAQDVIQNVSEKSQHSKDIKKVVARAVPRAREQKTQQSKKKRSKKYLEKAQLVDKTKSYALNEAIDLAKQTSYTKFPGSLELHINTNVKNIRGLVNLPFMSGKKLRILAFLSAASGPVDFGEDVEIGTETKLAEIEKGKIDFDILVTTPQWMSKLARVAKVLGPKGLMPNPKNGTITDDLKKAVAELQAGRLEYKTEKDNQVIHLSIGKVNQPYQELEANIKQLYQNIGKSKITKLVISPTMGIGIKVDPASI